MQVDAGVIKRSSYCTYIYAGLPDGLFSYQKSKYWYVYLGGPWNEKCWEIL
jgi:hypothetical protein